MSHGLQNLDACKIATNTQVQRRALPVTLLACRGSPRVFCPFHTVPPQWNNTFCITPHYLHILEHIGSINYQGIHESVVMGSCGRSLMTFPLGWISQNALEQCKAMRYGMCSKTFEEDSPPEYMDCWILLQYILIYKTGV